MKIYFCAAKDSPFGVVRQRLKALDLEITDAANVAGGRMDCDLCLLVLSPELSESIKLIRESRQRLDQSLPLIVCGAWTDIQSVTSLLAAGADDYLAIDLETRQLGLRLHIFVQKAAQSAARCCESAKRKQSDEELVRNQRLETLASLTGSFAHDYNNLLSAIQGNAELALMDMSLDAPVRYSLEQINSAAYRAAEITRQILTFRGSAVMNGDQQVNLSQLIREMSELLRVSVARNCRIEYQNAITLPTITGDPIGLRMLVMGMVTTASRELMPGGGTIQVRTSCQEFEGAPMIGLEVQYVHSDSNSGSAGSAFGVTDSGAGMAAAKVIASKHGTEIYLHPNPSGGTHSVSFPSSSVQSAKQVTGTMPAEQGRPAGTILLIDDEEAVRVAAHRLLRRAGYTVFEASSGEEGLFVMAQVASALDAVLVDLNMPGLECRHLLQQLRHLRRDLRLVVWSGFPEEAAREQLAGFPDVDFIEKPTQLGELVGVLQRVLQT